MGSKLTLSLAAFLIAAIALIFLLPAPDRPDETSQRTDLPWQITVFPDGSSQVLDLRLGVSTLQDAMNKFGLPEGMALYLHNSTPANIEVYFGTVTLGPLKAKVIANLAVDSAQKEAMAQRAVKRESTPTGDPKLVLSAEDQQLLTSAAISNLSYSPTYGGLEADFFRERLGEPAAWKKGEESQVFWFYPDRGLTLLIDAEGKELFEYQRPDQFQLPENTSTTPL